MSSEPVTVDELIQALKATCPPNAKLSVEDELPLDPELRRQALDLIEAQNHGDFLANVSQFLPDSATLVHSNNIWIGGKKDVKDLDQLQKLAITDIVNVAHGENSLELYVPDLQALESVKVEYHAFTLSDLISSQFDENHEKVLEEAVQKVLELAAKNDKKIMVVCSGGMSRSATTVICYLMRGENMTACQAITQLRQSRDVNPSKQQLLYVARLQNKICGHENVQVIDPQCPISYLRQLIVQAEASWKKLKKLKT